MGQQVFLSHSTQDKTFVEQLAHDLTGHGLHVWYSDWEIKVGDSIVQKISQGINERLAHCCSLKSIAPVRVGYEGAGHGPHA